jgi:hypothetical protein
MDFDPEEKKIQELLSRHKMKPVPESIMKNFAEEVMRKAHVPAPFPYLPVFAFSLALAFAIAGATAFFIMKPEPAPAVKAVEETNAAPGMSLRESPEGRRSNFSPEIASLPPVARNDSAMATIQPPELDTARMDKLAQEMFILDMLGEETGFDNLARLQTDLEFISVATS